MPRGVTSAARAAAILLAVASVVAAPSHISAAPFVQSGPVIDLPPGGNLQQALNAAVPGATIRLAAGATYVGPFTLPAKNGSDYITITTATASLPPAGTRIGPNHKPYLATSRSSTTISAITTAAGASYYRFVGVAFAANQNGAGDIITLGGAAATTVAQLPHHIELDRVLIQGDPVVGQKRGVSVNAAHVTIVNSYISDIMAVGQDSQAICGWNTPGPIVIRNNYLEAAGENIMFGGAGVSIPGVVPSDILVEDNVLTKDLSWRSSSWTVKNLFELKHGRRVVVRRNAMINNWAAAQQGFAIVFTPRNSGGSTSWVIEDIEFSGNVVAHSSSVFNLLGHDDLAPSGQLSRVLIKNNLFYDIGTIWGGTGTFAQIGGEPSAVAFDHNTVLHDGNIITFYGGPIVGLTVTNNLFKHNAYGIFGVDQAYGNGSLAYYAPGAIVQRNVFASDPPVTSRYPAGNLFPTVASFLASFVNPAAYDYRLSTTSPYLRAGTDGADLGANFGLLPTTVAPRTPTGVRIR
jgi:hypothetical protein